MMYPINHFRNYIKNLLNPLIFTRISDNFLKLTIQVNYFFLFAYAKSLIVAFLDIVLPLVFILVGVAEKDCQKIFCYELMFHHLLLRKHVAKIGVVSLDILENVCVKLVPYAVIRDACST